MTPLRHLMIEAMRLRGFVPRTHVSYLRAVKQLARHYGRSPDDLSVEELAAYFRYLVLVHGLSPASCRQHLNEFRLLYLQVLLWRHFDVDIEIGNGIEQWQIADRALDMLVDPLARPATAVAVQRDTLSMTCPPSPVTGQRLGHYPTDVRRTNKKHQMMLSLCYGCVLRVTELVAVRVTDIDGERPQLRIEQGKGQKDRRVTISHSILQALGGYWRARRQTRWLFPSESRPREAVTISTAQRTYGRAKARAQIRQQGGIHALRHAFATHQLEVGCPCTA